jgi:hypothetical protein
MTETANTVFEITLIYWKLTYVDEQFKKQQQQQNNNKNDNNYKLANKKFSILAIFKRTTQCCSDSSDASWRSDPG